jgi:hypothetical protein
MSVTVKGPLQYAAENRIAVDGAAVLILTIKTDRGWPFEVRMPFGADGALQAAAYPARLPRGTHITVEAEGAVPRFDHGLAVLVLHGINRVDARSDTECFVVPGLSR